MIAGLVLACISALLLYLGGQPVLGPAFGGTLVLVMVIRVWIAPTRWLRTAPYLTERRNLRITPERLFLETASVKSEFPWEHFIAWNESSEFLMLDLTPEGYCSVFPKSEMTPEQQELFRKWAAAKLPKSPGRLKRD